MTASINYSDSSNYNVYTKQTRYFQVEILDWEDETHFFEVEADSQSEAESKAYELASDYSIDANMINIYCYAE